MTCPACEVEWNGWVLGVDCPDCGAPGRDVDWRGYLWTASAATATPRDHSKWGLR